MNEILIIVYLLIGFQFGGRMFYWSVSIDKKFGDFIASLIAVPLLWPFILVVNIIFPKSGMGQALWKWYG